MRRGWEGDVFHQELGDVHGGDGVAQTHRRHEGREPVGIGLVDEVVDGGLVSALLIDEVEGGLLGGQDSLVQKRALASDICGRSWRVDVFAVILLNQNEAIGVGEAEGGADVGGRRLDLVDDADLPFRFGVGEGV